MLVEIINKLLDFLRNESPNIRVLFVNSIKGTTDVWQIMIHIVFKLNSLVQMNLNS